MLDDIVLTIVLFCCTLYSCSITAAGSFEYYVIKRKVSDDEQRAFVDRLKFPLNKLYKWEDHSLFSSLASPVTYRMMNSDTILSALVARWIGIIFSIMCSVMSTGNVIFVDNLVFQISMVLVFMVEITIMVRAWRFGHTLGR